MRTLLQIVRPYPHPAPAAHNLAQYADDYRTWLFTPAPNITLTLTVALPREAIILPRRTADDLTTFIEVYKSAQGY